MQELLNLAKKTQGDDYKDPRESEVMNFGVERLDKEGEHFMIVSRDCDGKIRFRSLAHWVDGAMIEIRKAFTDFYMPLPRHSDQNDIDKTKDFLRKKSQETIEEGKCQ